MLIKYWSSTSDSMTPYSTRLYHSRLDTFTNEKFYLSRSPAPRSWCHAISQLGLKYLAVNRKLLSILTEFRVADTYTDQIWMLWCIKSVTQKRQCIILFISALVKYSSAAINKALHCYIFFSALLNNAALIPFSTAMIKISLKFSSAAIPLLLGPSVHHTHLHRIQTQIPWCCRSRYERCCDGMIL